MTCAFIDDGYTESATLAEIPGVIPAIRFDFRPLMSSELGEFLHSAEKMTEPEARREVAKRIASKITDWDLRDKQGAKVEIKSENVLKLKPPAFIGLWEIIQSKQSGDRAEADQKN